MHGLQEKPGCDESPRPEQSYKEVQLDAFSSQKEASSREVQGSLCRSACVYIKSHQLGNANVEMQIPKARGPLLAPDSDLESKTACVYDSVTILQMVL